MAGAALARAAAVLNDGDVELGTEPITKFAPPPAEDSDEALMSRIPKKYHIVQSFPLYPRTYAEQGYRCYNRNGLWHVVIWPSPNPGTRQDVQYLADASRLMMSELRGDCGVVVDMKADVEKSRVQAATLMQAFSKRLDVCRLCLDELIREISADCVERGTLLKYLLDELTDAFAQVPNQMNVALRVLKREVDGLRVSLGEKTLQLQSETQELKEQINMMGLERRMELEWHAQLEAQVERWKVQLDGYRRKAKEEARIECELREAQLQGLRETMAELRRENAALKEQVQSQRTELLRAEKRCAELEEQMENAKEKNEQLTLRMARHQGEAAAEAEGLVEESLLGRLIGEFPGQSPGTLPLKDMAAQALQLLEGHFEAESPDQLDDFYAKRLLLTEDTPQLAALAGRRLLASLQASSAEHCLSRILIDLLQRKFPDHVLRLVTKFYGFFLAQPFQGQQSRDAGTDVPVIPTAMAQALVGAMFGPMGEAWVNETQGALRDVQSGDRGREPTLSISLVLDVVLQRYLDASAKRAPEAVGGFNRSYMRYTRAIQQRLGSTDSAVARMDWKTFRDFLKGIRTDLGPNGLQDAFFRALTYSDSVASVTADAFDAACVAEHMHLPATPAPGSCRRLRFVPTDLSAQIEASWQGTLRNALKRAIAELSKNERSQAAVATLRTIEQRFEEIVRNTNAGPFALQLLHEAASVVAREGMSIASNLQTERAFAALEKQLSILT